MKRIILFSVLAAVLLGGGVSAYLFRDRIFPSTDFELGDELGGNIFPSLILAVATTDTMIVQPDEKPVLGNPKSHISIRVDNPRPNSRLRIEVAETPFFKRSVSEFILPEEDQTYTVYPDILWNFDALRNNVQAEPANVSVTATLNESKPTRRTRIFSVRSVNECLIGYNDKQNRFHNTGVLFAAYVNEDSPLIDQILRTRASSTASSATKAKRRIMWTNKSMPCGTCCNGASSATAPSPTAACRATWSMPSGYARWRTPSPPRKSTAWTAACCSPPC